MIYVELEKKKKKNITKAPNFPVAFNSQIIVHV